MHTGILIARFQAPFLSGSAIAFIKNLRSFHQQFAIVLGESALPGTKKNPLDFQTRKNMILEIFPETDILLLQDHPSDEIWAKNLESLLEEEYPGSGFTLYGSKDRVVPAYNGKHKLVELPEHLDFEDEAEMINSEDFRMGMVQAFQKQYNKVYPTVDIALFRNNKSEILLGQKPEVNQWRLIGGFSDPEGDNYETAALRELKEECGDINVNNLQYETSAKIDDWRYRHENDKIITLLFSCDYRDGNIEAQDDIVSVKWFEINKINDLILSNTAAGEHEVLLQFLAGKYAKK